MTRHNLAGHISWLLSRPVTPPVGVCAPPSIRPTVATQVVPEDILVDEIEEEIPREPLSPGHSRAAARPDNGGRKFLRPNIPSTAIPNIATHELAEGFRQDSMGKLSSTSKSARPALLSQQQQLATPASTTGPSSLTARYAAFTGTSNGLNWIILWCWLSTDFLKGPQPLTLR